MTTKDKNQERMLSHLLGSVAALGRKTISGIICSLDQQKQDWTSHYRLYSKGRCDPESGFREVLRTIVQRLCKGTAVITAMDDTLVKKSGKKIRGVKHYRDPLGPKFHTNLVRSQRFIEVSACVSEGSAAMRMVPILLRDAPSAHKPSKKASEQEWCEYREQQKEHNLSSFGVEGLKHVRRVLDECGQYDRPLWVGVDGSYTNRTVLRKKPERTDLVGRIRKDAKLYYVPTVGHGNRIYGARTPTPEQLRTDSTIPWQEVEFDFNGRKHHLRVKTLENVRSPMLGRPALKVVVVAPLGYRLRKGSKRLYRKPVYLGCTNPELPIVDILKVFLSRWGIEENFRDEKTVIGLGEAQVRNESSVERVPQLMALAYALLLLAGVQAYGVSGVPQVTDPAKWYANPQKNCASTEDLIRELRQELWAEELATDNTDHFVTPPKDVTKQAVSHPTLRSSMLNARS